MPIGDKFKRQKFVGILYIMPIGVFQTSHKSLQESKSTTLKSYTLLRHFFGVFDLDLAHEKKASLMHGS